MPRIVVRLPKEREPFQAKLSPAMDQLVRDVVTAYHWTRSEAFLLVELAVLRYGPSIARFQGQPFRPLSTTDRPVELLKSKRFRGRPPSLLERPGEKGGVVLARFLARTLQKLRRDVEAECETSGLPRRDVLKRLIEEVPLMVPVRK